MRRRRGLAHTVRPQLTDENGQPITFATPGEPTPEERRRYAHAIQRATTRRRSRPSSRQPVMLRCSAVGGYCKTLVSMKTTDLLSMLRLPGLADDRPLQRPVATLPRLECRQLGCQGRFNRGQYAYPTSRPRLVGLRLGPILQVGLSI
jgi:hypothetical protein